MNVYFNFCLNFCPQAVREDVVQKKPLLDDAKTNGDWLVQNNRQDPTLKEDVEDKLEKTEDKHDDFATKVDIRYQRLQKALLKSQEFEKAVNDFTGNLGELEEKVKEEEPLTVDFDQLKRLKEQHEVWIHI